MGIKEFLQQSAESERDNIRDIRIPAEKKQKEAKIVLKELNKGFEKRIFDYMEKLLKQGAYKGNVALGLAGYYITFVWRIKRVEEEDFREEREPMPVRLTFKLSPIRQAQGDNFPRSTRLSLRPK